MASPKYEVFFIYDSNGDPLPGLTIGGGGVHFSTYKDETGSDLSQPTIIEIGGGAYRFLPVFTTDHAICYVINTGQNPKYVTRFIRPEDYAAEAISGGSFQDALDALLGKWEIKTSGADQNRLILYRQDGVTVLKKFDLYDRTGIPTFQNPFRREPI